MLPKTGSLFPDNVVHFPSILSKKQPKACFLDEQPSLLPSFFHFFLNVFWQPETHSKCWEKTELIHFVLKLLCYICSFSFTSSMQDYFCRVNHNDKKKVLVIEPESINFNEAINIYNIYLVCKLCWPYSLFSFLCYFSPLKSNRCLHQNLFTLALFYAV